jgi:uncharacterized alpha/beta hydrolase family protein
MWIGEQKMKRGLIFILILGFVGVISLCTPPVCAQESPPSIDWNYSIEGNYNDQYSGIYASEMHDGSYVVFGNHSDWYSVDYSFMIKLGNKGQEEWRKNIGSGGIENIFPVENGGFILAVYTTNDNVQNTLDFIKLSDNGVKEWEYSITDNSIRCNSICQTADGAFFFACNTSSWGSYTNVLFKLDNNGKLLWDKTYNTNDGANSGFYSIADIDDNNYMLIGWQGSANNIWFIKIDENGNSISTDETQLSLGSDYLVNRGGYFIKTADGEYISTHEVWDSVTGAGTYTLIAKWDSNGDLIWQNRIAPLDGIWLSPINIEQTSDGGCILTAMQRFTSDHQGNVGVIVKVDKNANRKWQLNMDYRGDMSDIYCAETADHGYIYAGCTDDSSLYVAKLKYPNDDTFNTDYTIEYEVEDGESLQLNGTISAGSNITSIKLKLEDDAGEISDTPNTKVFNLNTFDIETDSPLFDGPGDYTFDIWVETVNHPEPYNAGQIIIHVIESLPVNDETWNLDFTNSYEVGLGQSIPMQGTISATSKINRVELQVFGYGTYDYKDINSTTFNLNNFSIDTAKAPFNQPGAYEVRLWAKSEKCPDPQEHIGVISVIVKENPVNNEIWNYDFTNSYEVNLGDTKPLKGTISATTNITCVTLQVFGYGEYASKIPNTKAFDLNNFTIDTSKAPFNKPGTYEVRLWAKSINCPDPQDYQVITVTITDTAIPRATGIPEVLNVIKGNTVTLSGIITCDINLRNVTITVKDYYGDPEHAGVITRKSVSGKSYNLSNISIDTKHPAFTTAGTYHLSVWANTTDLSYNPTEPLGVIDLTVAVSPDGSPSLTGLVDHITVDQGKWAQLFGTISCPAGLSTVSITVKDYYGNQEGKIITKAVSGKSYNLSNIYIDSSHEAFKNAGTYYLGVWAKTADPSYEPKTALGIITLEVKPVLKSIRVNPTDARLILGETYNLKDLFDVKGIYSNGVEKDIESEVNYIMNPAETEVAKIANNATITGTVLGNQNLYINYDQNVYSSGVAIHVVDLKSIHAVQIADPTEDPAKITLEVGETKDLLKELKVTATFSDNKTEDFTNKVNFNMVQGNQIAQINNNATITGIKSGDDYLYVNYSRKVYDESGVLIHVKKLTSIQPQTTGTIRVGLDEDVKLTDVVDIWGIYDDGTPNKDLEYLGKYTITGNASLPENGFIHGNSLGNATLKYEYKGFTATFNISVVELTSIQPKDYTIFAYKGDAFNLEDELDLYKYYSDGFSEDLPVNQTRFSLDGGEYIDVASNGAVTCKNIGTSYITFTYQGKSCVVDIQVLDSKDIPTIIIHGVGGGRLYYDEDRMWEPGLFWNDKAPYLECNADGSSTFKEVYFDDSSKFDTVKDYMTSMGNYLSNQGFNNIEYFNYDWRLDNTDAADKLNKRINTIKNNYHCKSVNIIAHSMGGLVASKYIQEYGSQNVNKLITIGTPFLGAPKVINTFFSGQFLYADDRYNDISDNVMFVVDTAYSDSFKKYTRHMLGALELLPSKEYLDNSTEENHDKTWVIRQNTEKDAEDFEEGKYPSYDAFIPDHTNTKILGYDKTITYLKNALNKGTQQKEFDTLIDKVSDFQNNLDLVNTLKTVDSYFIIGVGHQTIGEVSIWNSDSITNQVSFLEYIDGDQTVPVRSATINDALLKEPFKDKTYFVKGKEATHSGLLKIPAVQNQVKNILSGNSTTDPGLSKGAYTKTRGLDCILNCPVNLDIYDPDGNHNGFINSSEYEINIPGSEYNVLGETKISSLPLGDYNIRLSGTGSGKMTFTLKETDNNFNTSKQIQFTDIPVTEKTIMNIRPDIDNNTTLVLKIDNNGDGIIDEEVKPTITSNENQVGTHGSSTYHENMFSKTIAASSGGLISYENVELKIAPKVLQKDATISINKLEGSEVDKIVSNALKLKIESSVYEVSTTGERNFGDKTIDIKFLCNSTKIAAGEKIVISYYNEEIKQWVTLPTTIIDENGKLYATAKLNHLTKFTVYRVKQKYHNIMLKINDSFVTLDNQIAELEVKPFIKPVVNRTLVPIRFVAESLGANVEWLSGNKVKISLDDKEITLTIGSNELVVNGVSRTTDCAPEILPPGRTMVPLRVISEILGATVDYDLNNKTILITN